MKTLLLTTMIFLTNAAYANSENSALCEQVREYVPPALEGKPHVLKTATSDLVFWPYYVNKMELHPWEMVCREVCILKETDHWFKHRKVYTIKNTRQFTLGKSKDC